MTTWLLGQLLVRCVESRFVKYTRMKKAGHIIKGAAFDK